MKNKHIGSDFDDFLKEEGIHEEVTAAAIKRVIAWQLSEAMKAKRLSKTETAAGIAYRPSQSGSGAYFLQCHRSPKPASSCEDKNQRC